VTIFLTGNFTFLQLRQKVSRTRTQDQPDEHITVSFVELMPELVPCEPMPET
jgi:hypothetical protein